MAKKVTGKQSLSAVRLTQEAKEKLCVIAERKCTTLGIAASRIILHYATDAFDFRGNPIMQIRLSKEDYVRYKSQYEKLCISQTM